MLRFTQFSLTNNFPMQQNLTLVSSEGHLMDRYIYNYFINDNMIILAILKINACK